MRKSAGWLARMGCSLVSGIDFIIKAMAIMAGGLVIVLTTMICVAVLLRYYFNLSVGWTTELLEYFIFLIVMFGTPWVLKNNDHVQVDVVLNAVSPRMKRYFNIIANMCGLAVGCAILYYGFLAFHENYVKGTLMIKILPIPKYVPLAFVPIMAFFTSSQFLLKIIDFYQSKPEGEPKNAD